MIRYFAVMLLAVCAWGQTGKTDTLNGISVGPSMPGTYALILPNETPKLGDCLKVEDTGASGNLYKLVPIGCSTAPEPLCLTDHGCKWELVDSVTGEKVGTDGHTASERTKLPHSAAIVIDHVTDATGRKCYYKWNDIPEEVTAKKDYLGRWGTPAPLDVPAIQKDYVAHKKGETYSCGLNLCLPDSDVTETRWTCADPERILEVSESGKHWCRKVQQ